MEQLYRIYESRTIDLVRSMVIKLDMINDAINTDLRDFKGYAVNPYDKSTHKYYMNIAGEYHRHDHDTLYALYGSEHIMVIVATDTGTMKTPFIKSLFHGENANRSLLNEYQINSPFYKRLISQYPEFETLIKGILNPVDIDIAISSPNGSILSIGYNQLNVREGNHYYTIPDSLKGTSTSALIESQEYNLIYELQSYINGVINRWVIEDYALLDDLYVTAFFGSLIAVLPSKVMNIRLKNTHTPTAHSFHIYNYLQSHGLLGNYIYAIPHEQILYLYRNVRYLELNLGKTFVFDEIIKNLFTPTGIPIAGYYLTHDISQMSNDNLLPYPYLQREHLNFKSIGAGDDTRTIEEVLLKQIPLARDNDKYLSQTLREVEQKARRCDDNELVTKVLESELIKHATSLPVEFTSLLVWYWVYLSSKGLYTAKVFVTNPVTEERIALTPINGFILFLYCNNLATLDNKLEYIPQELTIARYIKKSDISEYQPDCPEFSSPETIDTLMGFIDKSKLSRDEVIDIIGDYKGDYKAHDPKSFYDLVAEQYLELQRQFFTVCKIEDVYARGYAEYLFKQSYWHDVPVELSNKKVTYESWLSKLAIDFKYFNAKDYHSLAQELLAECTGMNPQTDITERELQKAMISVLQYFSSYSTHVLSSVSESSVTNLGGKYLRIGNLTGRTLDNPQGSPLDLSLDLKQSAGYGEISFPILVYDLFKGVSLTKPNTNFGQYVNHDKPQFKLAARVALDTPTLDFTYRA